MKGAQSTSSCLQELSWRHPCAFHEFLSALGLTFAEFCFAMASDGAAPPTGTAEVTSFAVLNQQLPIIETPAWCIFHGPRRLEQVPHLLFFRDATHCWPMLWCQAPPAGEVGEPRSIKVSTWRKCQMVPKTMHTGEKRERCERVKLAIWLALQNQPNQPPFLSST